MPASLAFLASMASETCLTSARPCASTCFLNMAATGSRPLSTLLNRRYMRARSAFCTSDSFPVLIQLHCAAKPYCTQDTAVTENCPAWQLVMPTSSGQAGMHSCALSQLTSNRLGTKHQAVRWDNKRQANADKSIVLQQSRLAKCSFSTRDSYWRSKRHL